MKKKWMSLALVGLVLAGCRGGEIAKSPQVEGAPSAVQKKVEPEDRKILAGEVELSEDSLEGNTSESDSLPLENLEEDTDLRVSGSFEEPLISIRNLQGKPLEEARNGLSEFQIRIVERYHSSIRKGWVIEQAPSMGEWAPDALVTLVVSLGPEPKGEEGPSPVPKPTLVPPPDPKPIPVPEETPIVLPQGVGEPLDSFRKALLDQGFEVMVAFAYHATMAKDRIFAMSPSPGTYPKKTTVKLTVSLGPEPMKDEEKTSTELPKNYGFQYEAALEAEIFRLLNAYRIENGLAPLELRQDLQSVARWKSNSMLQLDYISHDNPTLGNAGPLSLVRDIFGLKHYYSVGENLHVVTYIKTEAKDIMEAWKSSPGHNANMLHTQWKYAGVGVVSAGSSGSTFRNREVLLSTQMFAR